MKKSQNQDNKKFNVQENVNMPEKPKNFNFDGNSI